MLKNLLKPIFTMLFFLLATVMLQAQDKNPFQSIGKKGKILTLSHGKYEELFDQDSIQQIGTALVNIRQMKVVKLLEDEEVQRLLDNVSNSRFLSVDPLTRNFAWNSPYAYAENSPIKFIDLDGAEKYDPASKPTGITHVQLATVPMSPQDARTDYSIKAGPYQLYPISDPSGKRNSYWLARYTFTDGPYAGMHRDDWIVGVDGVGDFVKNGEKYYNKAGWIEHFGGADQQFNLKSVLNGYPKTWTPQNVATGLTIGLGGYLSLTQSLLRNEAKSTVSTRLRTQKQSTQHIVGGKATTGKSTMNSIEDAQKVLDALHNNKGQILKIEAGENRIYFKFDEVSGNFVHQGASESSNLFMIKGSSSGATVVPINPRKKF
jgi:hypothetical protein